VADALVTTIERRTHRRWTPNRPELTGVRIRAGSDAVVLNCSPQGAKLATLMRLLPGRPCVLAWPAMDGTHPVSGLVIRCGVGKLDATHGVWYHAAVRFDGPAEFLRVAATHTG
jgi:hypothetical protein